MHQNNFLPHWEYFECGYIRKGNDVNRQLWDNISTHIYIALQIAFKSFLTKLSLCLFFHMFKIYHTIQTHIKIYTLRMI